MEWIQSNPWWGEFLHRGAHLSMIELTSCCICVTKRGVGNLNYERCLLPPLVHSRSPPIFSKISNTWPIRPLGFQLHFCYKSEGFILICGDALNLCPLYLCCWYFVNKYWRLWRLFCDFIVSLWLGQNLRWNLWNFMLYFVWMMCLDPIKFK